MSFTVRKIREKPRRGSWRGYLIAALTISQPILGIYRGWKKQHDAEKRNSRRRSILKRLLLVVVSLFITFLLLAGIGKAILSVRGLGISSVLRVAGTELPKDTSGFTNVLLLGQGDAGHDGKNLTDTIMIASVDPTGVKSSVLLSLPRDLYLLSTEKMGKGKLNTLYRDYRSFLIYKKGMDPPEAGKETLRELAREIGRSLGLEIHHSVKVDFTAFVRAVDTIGGVDIDVPMDIEDREYPDENYGFDPFMLKQGMRHLDGATALKYARSRHSSSDFGRSARQQQLLRAMAAKAKAQGILTDAGAITSFVSIMRENVETTMTLREMIGAAALIEKLDKDRVMTMQLSDRNALYDGFIEPGGFLYTPPRDLFDGAAVFLPISLPEFPVTWKQIHTLAELFFNKREIYAESPTISVLNAGAPPGIARKLATELIRYGFDVPIIENAKTEKLPTSMILQVPEPDSIAIFFGTLFDLPLLPAPSDLPATQQRRVTILLGRDFRYAPLQDLVQKREPIPLNPKF